MNVDASTLSRNLKPLVAAGWVTQEPGADARSRLVQATDAGREKRVEAQRRWRVAQEGVNAALGPQRVIALHALIDEAMQALDDGRRPELSRRVLPRRAGRQPLPGRGSAARRFSVACRRVAEKFHDSAWARLAASRVSSMGSVTSSEPKSVRGRSGGRPCAACSATPPSAPCPARGIRGRGPAGSRLRAP